MVVMKVNDSTYDKVLSLLFFYINSTAFYLYIYVCLYLSYICVYMHMCMYELTNAYLLYTFTYLCTINLWI